MPDLSRRRFGTMMLATPAIAVTGAGLSTLPARAQSTGGAMPALYGVDLGSWRMTAILDGIARVRSAGKAAGVLATDPIVAHEYLQAGALFVAVGVDVTLLVKGATTLLRGFKTLRSEPPRPGASAY